MRTGRAHTGLLDHVRVDYYGQAMPINQVANVTLIDARTIGVPPFEKKMAAVIEKAIRESDLGLNPASQGDTIRVPMPALTEERRKELIKVVQHEGENARVAVRNLRRDANKHLKDLLKKHEVPENDERRAQDDVQKLTDRHIAEIDKLLQQKEADLMACRPRSARAPRPDARELHADHPADRTGPAPRRHHHGRQRPLGEAPVPAARRRPPARRGSGARHRARLRRARRRVPDAVRVQLRELAPAGRGGVAPDAAVPRCARAGGEQAARSGNPSARDRRPRAVRAKRSST